MRLRPYAGSKNVFLEVAHYVAHPDARARGVAQQSITAFVDSIRYFQEYISEKQPLDLGAPFPAYVYRLFLSQTRLADERRLKAEYKMSHATLIKKIEANFLVDRKSATCTLRANKGGIELLAALQFVTGFIHARAAFHIRDFHIEIKEVMRTQKVNFAEQEWDAQTERISLAILCLVSNTSFVLADGSQANCKLGTENHFMVLSGQRRLPTGVLTSEPSEFGNLTILGEATAHTNNKGPLRINFPLIDTDLDPRQHCDPSLFLQGRGPEEFGNYDLGFINVAADMSLSDDFKLVRTDSYAQ